MHSNNRVTTKIHKSIFTFLINTLEKNNYTLDQVHTQPLLLCNQFQQHMQKLVTVRDLNDHSFFLEGGGGTGSLGVTGWKIWPPRHLVIKKVQSISSWILENEATKNGSHLTGVSPNVGVLCIKILLGVSTGDRASHVTKKCKSGYKSVQACAKNVIECF